MTGFYITVKNSLLDEKHYQAMGGDRGANGSIWLFLWLLDKMTVINHETGEGKVLGGRPIQFEDVHADLGVSRSTYLRWVATLKKGGYITTTRTQYGLSIVVHKASKIFKQKSEGSRGGTRCVTNDTSGKVSDVSSSTHLRGSDVSSSKHLIRQDNMTRHKGAVPFESFWALYPKKSDKKRTQKVWEKLTQAEQEAAILDLPVRCSQHDPWHRGYIPNPSTYLNGERWNDAIEKIIKPEKPLTGASIASEIKL